MANSVIDDLIAYANDYLENGEPGNEGEELIDREIMLIRRIVAYARGKYPGPLPPVKFKYLIGYAKSMNEECLMGRLHGVVPGVVLFAPEGSERCEGFLIRKRSGGIRFRSIRGPHPDPNGYDIGIFSPAQGTSQATICVQDNPKSGGIMSISPGHWADLEAWFNSWLPLEG